MRNIEATETTVISSFDLISKAQHFCINADKELSVWITTSNDLCCIEDGKVCSVAPLFSHMTSGDLVVGMEFVSDLESVCLALSNGDVLMYNTLSGDFECVGGVDVGLSGMSWSPDQEVVVLVTRDDKLVLMTLNFDPITATTLHPEEFGEAQPVTVGWGKKETQFHGSQGKPKQKAAQVEKVVSPALPSDDKKVRISWRGDGEYFVSSCVDPTSGSRKIRVWNRMCVLQATSDRLDGLGQCLDWRPTGNLIASTQLKPHRQDVVFFERNGLQHGEFPLCAGEGGWMVREVKWNNDSSVLAIFLEGEETTVEVATSEQNPPTKVQLWTVGNYHWYLKQEIRITSNRKLSETTPTATPTTGLVGIVWDPIKPLRLHMLTKDGVYMCYNWRWSVATDHTHSSQNSAPVAVIDGTSVLVTPFRHSVVPPPMSAYKLTLPSPVNSVSFAPPPLSNNFLCLLSSGQLALFGHKEREDDGVNSLSTKVQKMERGVVKDAQGFRQVTECPSLTGVTAAAISEPFHTHSVRQVTWWKPDKFLAIGQEAGSDVVMEFRLLVDKEKSKVIVSNCCSIPTPSPVSCLTANPDNQTAVVQLANGKGLLRILTDCRSGSGDLQLISCDEQSGLCLPKGQTCDQLALATFKDQEYAVGLNEFSGTLYVGDTAVTSGCTSFAVHNEFLVLTTTAHLLRFLSLNSVPKALPVLSSSEPHPQDETVRRLERGSKIVTVVPHDSKVVLQMPRGNLETIHPRALVLSMVRRNLDALEFKSAFVTMRRHRINLNLIHDHNPKVFMENVQQFVEQLDSVAHINLFLTELKEEDVTTTMYARDITQTSFSCGAGESVGGSKVDRVCEAVRRALICVGENKYLLSVITTHVRKANPDLEAVLAILKRLKAHPDPDQPVQTEEAVKYTLFLVDVNELYNIALGMYDFDLVLMIAEKSQKDPKEYLPFLNELRRLPVDYQRYRIDLFLRKFSKALEHVSKCGPEKFTECLSLIRDQSLYPQALRIYRDLSSSEYKAVANSYGIHLREKGKHKEAGIIFTQCGNLEEAIRSFEKAGNWRQVFSLSSQLQHSLPDRIVLARRIAATLRSSRRHSEAAQVLIDYAQDVEEGVVTLLEGSCWDEALRITHLHSRTDLIETHVRPNALEAQQSQMALFDSLEVTFLRHCSRLEVVRKKKKEKELAILEGTYAIDEKDADLFSDTSSITGRSAVSSINSSLLSKASGRSSKNRRKAERKKHSLREGSANEDIALIEALSEIVSTVDRLQDEVGNLLSMLVQFGLSEEGQTLQSSFEQLLMTVSGRMKEVWSPENQQLQEPAGGGVKELTGPAATVNSIVAALQSTASTRAIPSDVSPPSGPKIRDSVNWRLDIFS